jgi:hypothetical protein
MPFKVAINPVLGMWTESDLKSAKPSGSESFVLLMRLPPRSSGKSLTDSISSSAGSKDASIVSDKAVTLCNGTPGTEIQMKTQPKEGDKLQQPLLMQVVVGQGKAETLVAIYSRSASAPADPAAVAAVEKLCPSAA